MNVECQWKHVLTNVEWNYIVETCPNSSCVINGLEFGHFERMVRELHQKTSNSFDIDVANKAQTVKAMFIRYHNFTDFFTFSPSGVTRGHHFKLYKTRAERAKNTFFTNRVVNVWNAISPDIVDFTSLCRSTFQHTIKLADFSPFLKASMS